MKENFFVFIIVVIISGIIISGIAINLTIRINTFKKELKFLNTEIEKAEGNEKHYWLKRKKQLWRSLIPFVKY